MRWQCATLNSHCVCYLYNYCARSFYIIWRTHTRTRIAAKDLRTRERHYCVGYKSALIWPRRSFFGLFARRCIRVRPCVNMCGPHFRPNKCRDTYFIISHRAIPFLLSFQLGSIYFFASLCFFFSDFTARGIKRGDTCIHRERIKCV